MEKLLIASQDHLRFVTEDEILYCRADNCYTIIFLSNSEELIICNSLKKFSKELAIQKFVRLNQSYLVNVQYIRSIDKKKKLVLLSNAHQIHFTTSLKDLLENSESKIAV